MLLIHLSLRSSLCRRVKTRMKMTWLQIDALACHNISHGNVKLSTLNFYLDAGPEILFAVVCADGGGKKTWPRFLFKKTVYILQADGSRPELKKKRPNHGPSTALLSKIL